MTLSSHLNTYIELLFLSERSGFRSLVNKAEMLLQTNPVFSRLSFSIIRKWIVWHLFVYLFIFVLAAQPWLSTGWRPCRWVWLSKTIFGPWPNIQKKKPHTTEHRQWSEVSVPMCASCTWPPVFCVCVCVHCRDSLNLEEQMSGSTRHSLTMNYY